MKYIETQLLFVLFWQAGDPTFVAPVRPRLKAMMGTPPERKAFQNFRKTEGSEKNSGRETSAGAPDATSWVHLEAILEHAACVSFAYVVLGAITNMYFV